MIFSQGIYYSSITRLTDPYYRTSIGVFNIIDCSTKDLYVDTSSTISGYLEWGDIALSPDGKIYGLARDGIYLIDIANQNHIKIIDPPPFPRWKKGITCTKNNVLIFGERDIFGYDLNTSIMTHYGKVPFSLSIWSNIFLYNGMLMGSGNDKIIQIDTADPLNSKIYCTFPFSGLLSVTEVSISCDSVAIFAFFIGGEIYLVDPIDCSLSLYCKLPTDPPDHFQGSSPNFMFMPPAPCTIRLDLDFLDETISGNDYSDTIYCSLPASFIFSETDFYSDKPWDSLRIWIENGPPGISLETDIPPFGMVSGQSSNRLLITATNQSSFEQLNPIISSLRLSGNIPPGISNLKIGFLGWADQLRTDTAFAYITLIGRVYSSGIGQSIEICSSDSAINLFTLLSNDASNIGTWYPSTIQDGIFTPGQDSQGLYNYIVKDDNCGPDTAEFVVKTFPEPNFDLGNRMSICIGDTIHFKVDVPNATITWFDGTTGPNIYLTEPGLVWVNVFDEFGCSYEDSIQVLINDNCIIEKIFIPNVFSPDGNGINDDWSILPQPGVVMMEVSIYDRWGNILFHQRSASISWNGNTTSQQPVPPGVYVYSLELETTNHEKLSKIGDVSIVR